MRQIIQFINSYYYFFVIPFLSISIFFVMQYLTRGINYFISDRKIKWGFLAFMSVLQFFVSATITWSVLSAFNSDYLSDYDTLKMTAMIIIGSAPFNITVLIWVALKLEVYKLMRNRYGNDFTDTDFFKKVEQVENNEIKEISLKDTLLNKNIDNNANNSNKKDDDKKLNSLQ